MFGRLFQKITPTAIGEQPWRNIGGDIEDANGRSIGLARTEEIGDRIVNCVNACRGLNPEHVPELVGMIEALLPYTEMAQDDGPANGQGWKSDHLEGVLKSAAELLAKVRS